MHTTSEPIFRAMLGRRTLTTLALLLLTGILGAYAARVQPDYSIEMIFPRFDRSRVDYDRFKKDFPFEDAHAIVVVDAPDLFTPAGLGRVAALEKDLAEIPGVVDTQGLTTVKDVVSDGDDLRTEKLFPRADLPADELARRRAVATSDPLFAWNLAKPDGSATSIRVTLTRATASKEDTRTTFLKRARVVLARHEALARAAGASQKLTLSGLPAIRSQFTEMVNQDLGLLFPIAFLVIVLLLYLTFRSVSDVVASVVTILISVVWTQGVMGLFGVPLHILTEITPMIVMIISISDTAHIVTHFREALAGGATVREAAVVATADSALPCLLTEITIAGGFIGLAVNDMTLIQQFGLVTAAGVLFTWLANMTVLPLMLSVLPRRKGAARAQRPSAMARLFSGFVDVIEKVVTDSPRQVIVAVLVIAAGAALLSARVGKEYFSYDDLRPGSPLARDLRYVEAVHGGTVPLAIYIEPKGGPKGEAMLEPEALALIDRITQRLEHDFPEVKNAASLTKYMRKAHRLFAGPDAGALPATRALAAQELLTIEDPGMMRDILSFNHSTAAIYVMMPDEGSSKATHVIARLRSYFAEEEARAPYRITITGIYGIADGIYRSLVGGLAGSLAIAVLVSFVIFCLVLRSWRLAAIALVPNVLPLLVTLAVMSLLHIDIKPSTVIVFSITLVIADDDTIQYLSRFRMRFRQLADAGDPDPHAGAALGTLREIGLPMFITACAVSIGFLSLCFSQFLALANLGLLIGVSLMAAVFADLFISPVLIMMLKPRI
ncbi:MAG: efflux RND transporter permease subunit [Polyangia bacterium]